MQGHEVAQVTAVLGTHRKEALSLDALQGESGGLKRGWARKIKMTEAHDALALIRIELADTAARLVRRSRRVMGPPGIIERGGAD